MKRKLEYLRLQTKSALLWIPQIIVVAAIVAVIVVFAAYGITKYKKENKNGNLLNVAICYDEEDSSKMIRQAVSLISKEESISSVCRFTEMDYDSAITQLKDGTISVVVVIPKGFIRSVMNGSNKSIEVIFPKVGVNNSSYIYQEMLDSGASVLSTAEAGIYSMDDILDSILKVDDSRRERLENKLSEIYFSYGMDRNVYFKVTDVSKTEGLSTMQFYICTGFLFLLLFSGIICEKLFVLDNNSLTKVLRIIDIKEGYISFSKIASTSVVYTAIGWLALIFISLAGIRYKGVYNYVEITSVIGLLKSMIALLVLNVSLLSFIYFIFTLINNTIYKIIGLFVIGIVCMYISGCIMPTSLLPKLVRTIGYYLPTYYYFRLAGQVITSHVSISLMAINLAISVLLTVIASCCLKLRIRKE